MSAAWLVKQEPKAFAFARLMREQSTVWDGVRNAQARIHLRAMAPGDTSVTRPNRPKKRTG